MRVLDPVMESLPDQGIEKQSKDGQKKKRKAEEDEETSESPRPKKKESAREAVSGVWQEAPSAVPVDQGGQSWPEGREEGEER